MNNKGKTNFIDFLLNHFQIEKTEKPHITREEIINLEYKKKLPKDNNLKIILNKFLPEFDANNDIFDIHYDKIKNWIESHSQNIKSLKIEKKLNKTKYNHEAWLWKLRLAALVIFCFFFSMLFSVLLPSEAEKLVKKVDGLLLLETTKPLKNKYTNIEPKKIDRETLAKFIKSNHQNFSKNNSKYLLTLEDIKGKVAGAMEEAPANQVNLNNINQPPQEKTNSNFKKIFSLIDQKNIELTKNLVNKISQIFK